MESHLRKPVIPVTDYLLVASLALVSFLPFLGRAPLFDWDEINFAESAREMLVTGDFFQVQINYEPFWEKPPLFIWLQVLSMKLFGVNEFAARFPNAIAGVVTLLALFSLGVRAGGRRLGWVTAGFFAASILPFVYFKSGIIDPVFNLFIFLALAQLIRFEGKAENEERSNLFVRAGLAALWTGLATLTKGPVALLIVVLVYLIFSAIYRRFRLPLKTIPVFLGIYASVILAWFGAIIVLTPGGTELVKKFLVYQFELFSTPVAGHDQPFWYHFVVFVFGCFPLSAFAFRGMFFKPQNKFAITTKQFMLVWFWVVLILFSIVRTKIVHYSSMLYFPGALLAALYFDELISSARKIKWDTAALLIFCGSVFGLAAAGVNFLVSRIPDLIPLISDPFARENLASNVQWTGWEFIPGLIFLLGSAVAVFYVLKRKYKVFLIVQAASSCVLLNGGAGVLAPRIAGYSQQAATDFFSAHAEEDAYMIVYGYKSYAHFFYGRVKPFSHLEIEPARRLDWLREGPVDKPVYLSAKSSRIDANFREWYKNFTPLYSQSGFVFLKRNPVPATPAH